MSFIVASPVLIQESVEDLIGASFQDTATVDFTYTDNGSGAGTIKADVIQAGLDHGSVSGLSDDDHAQYFKVTGRADEFLTMSANASILWASSGTGDIGASAGQKPRHIFASGQIQAAQAPGTVGTLISHNNIIVGDAAAISTTQTSSIDANVIITQNANVQASIYSDDTDGTDYQPAEIGFTDLINEKQYYFGFNSGDSGITFNTFDLGLEAEVDLVKFTDNADGTGNVLISGALGVGNSESANTLGTVAKKMEVFDAAGVSLGFIAIYDAITTT